MQELQHEPLESEQFVDTQCASYVLLNETGDIQQCYGSLFQGKKNKKKLACALGALMINVGWDGKDSDAAEYLGKAMEQFGLDQDMTRKITKSNDGILTCEGTKNAKTFEEIAEWLKDEGL